MHFNQSTTDGAHPTHIRRPQGDGTYQASSVSFKIDTQDALPVAIGKGQGILVRMTGDPLGAAKVLAVVQVQPISLF